MHPQAALLDTVQKRLSALHNEAEDELKQRLSVQDICDAEDLIIQGFGARRVAMLIKPSQDGPLVAKLAWRQAGLADNALELRLYRAADEELRRLLAPTFEQTPGGVNIQGLCLPIVSEDIRVHHSLTRRLARAGITDAMTGLGLYQGRVVCYDYAMLGPKRALRLLRDSTS